VAHPEEHLVEARRALAVVPKSYSSCAKTVTNGYETVKPIDSRPQIPTLPFARSRFESGRRDRRTTVAPSRACWRTTTLGSMVSSVGTASRTQPCGMAYTRPALPSCG